MNMNPFAVLEAMLLVLVPVVAWRVVRAHPPGSPARARRPFTIGSTMVLMAITALGFARLPTGPAALLTAALWLLAISPYPLFWQTVELATAAWWLPCVMIEGSDLSGDLIRWLVLAFVGLFLMGSWVARTWIGWRRPESRADWVSLLLVPTALGLALALVPTRVAFQARLAASDSALLAFAREAPAGYRQTQPQRVGLFWAEGIEEREGCVLWTTGGFMLISEGIAYIPTSTPPSWPEHRFEHIRGPWWRFWN